jgi:uncharacterized protein with GYD domain
MRKKNSNLSARVKEFYLLMGEYEMIAVVEAPDDETSAKPALMIGARGISRRLTLRAFSETEYRKVASELP